MPRTMQEIIDHADELARRFADHQPDPDSIHDADTLARVRALVLARPPPSETWPMPVADAPTHGHSWAAIGAMLGTSGEAARQRYGRPAVTR